MITIDVERFEALLFDLDGVITQTASIHARAWKQTFDEYFDQRAARSSTPFVPFDLETDYRSYVDGKPRLAGALSLLASRGIDMPRGETRGSNETRNGSRACRRQRSLFRRAFGARRSSGPRLGRSSSSGGPQVWPALSRCFI